MTFDEEIGLLLPQSTSESETKACLALDDAASLEAIFGISFTDNISATCSREDVCSSLPATHSSDNSSVLMPSLISSTIPTLEGIAGGMACAPFSGNGNTGAVINSNDNVVEHKDLQFINALPVGKQARSSSLHEDCLHTTQRPKKTARRTQQIAVQYTEKEKRERKYECEYCRKRFSRPSSLVSHIYTHTGERPYACEFPGCTKRFSVQSNLRRHRKVHSNNRSRTSNRGCACGFQLARPPFPEKPLGERATQVAETTEMSSLNLLLAACMPDSSHLAGDNTRKTAPGLQHSHVYPHLCSSTHAFPQLGYAPSVRTTATAEHPPFRLAPAVAADDVINPVNSRGTNGLTLLADIRASIATLPRHSASVPLGNMTSDAENTPSPNPSQPLSLTNPRPEGNYNADNYLVHEPTNGLDMAITSTQIDAILSNVGTAYSGDSDSCSSTSENAIASGNWPLSLNRCGDQTAGPCPLSAPNGFAAFSPPFSQAIGDKTSNSVDLFANVPMIAEPTMLTNSSVTTKAMNSAINLKSSGAPENVEALLQATQAKQASINFEDLAHSQGACSSDNAHARSAVGDNETTTKALLDNLYSYLENS